MSRGLDELQDRARPLRGVGVEAQDDAGDHLHAVAVQRLDASSIGSIMLCSLDIAFSASGSGVSMPQKTVSNPPRASSQDVGRGRC